MNLSTTLTRSAERHGPATSIRLGDVALTYAQLETAAAQVARLLREKRVAPGDRVGLMLPNLPEFAALYYGILRAGAVVVPMNPLLKSREVTYYLADSGSTLMFAWAGAEVEARAGAAQAATDIFVVEPATFLETLPAADGSEVVERNGDDTAVILYTSGTTGQPKGAELTHENLRRNAEVVVSDLLHLTSDDVVFGGLPLFHSFGQTVTLNAAIAAGAGVALLPRFDAAETLRLLESQNVTVFEGVPTMYNALLGAPDRERYDVSALRVCVSGGAALPVEVLHSFEAAFGCVILEGYGLSETSPVASFNHPHRERKPGSIGTPIRGVEMKVVDDAGADVAAGEVGEIAIRGHNIMKGYWRKPDATAAAIRGGWFSTGDMARLDVDGYFFIVDRKKDLIIRGGYNVYPREVEEVLYEHPAVAEAAVVGVPHDALGEEVGAAVTLKPDATVTAEELRDYVKGLVAPYKYPRHVWIVDALPMGATGKILKREIRVPQSPTGG